MSERPASPSQPEFPGTFSGHPPSASDQPPTLLASQCPHCEETFFPRQEWCPRCLQAVDTIPLSPCGTLYSYTVIHVAPKSYSPPYALGYVDLPEGVRVLAQLDTQDFTGLRCGLSVQATWGPIRVDDQGQPVYSYKFKPVAS